jgi:hypothetical protein
VTPQDAQQQQQQARLAKLLAELPTIVCGDFNSLWRLYSVEKGPDFKVGMARAMRTSICVGVLLLLLLLLLLLFLCCFVDKGSRLQGRCAFCAGLKNLRCPVSAYCSASACSPMLECVAAPHVQASLIDLCNC